MLAQSSSPSVINSIGGAGNNGSIFIHYSVGEPVIETFSNSTNTITQGFLQPNDVYVAGVFQVSVYSGDVSCANVNDGFIIPNVSFNIGPVSYLWSTGDTLPALTGLAAGTYSFTITDSLGNLISQSATILPSNEPCPISIHHAFSPNQDQLNDYFIIDGIENYPENKVAFFNRWGNLIWESEQYDNKTKVWDGKDQLGNLLSEGTYFYIIEISSNKKSTYKGWVELTK
jgi:gliding motility-associated-like protein